jgi:HAD superfamily hydrolase (TIGR01509 family)
MGGLRHRVDGVLFDLDDTLAASGPMWEAAWQEYCARAGRAWSHEDAMACMGTGNWQRDIAARCGTEAAEAEQWCTDYMITAIGDGRVGLLDGALELLSAAADRAPAGLASAAPRPFVAAAVDALGLGPYLRAIVYADEAAAGKPSPAIYLLAAERLGADPARCVAVEDSAGGILSAHAARMRVLAIPNPGYPPSTQVLALAHGQASTPVAAVKVLIGLIEPVPGC